MHVISAKTYFGPCFGVEMRPCFVFDYQVFCILTLVVTEIGRWQKLVTIVGYNNRDRDTVSLIFVGGRTDYLERGEGTVIRPVTTGGMEGALPP